VSAAIETIGVEVTSGEQKVVARPGHPFVVGRERGCQLVIDDPLVSRRHAELVYGEDGWLLRDLDSRNGTYWQDDRSAFVAVVDGCEVRLGDPDRGPLIKFDVREDLPAQPVHAPADETGSLQAVSTVARTPVTAYAASGDRMRIGRTPDNDIVLDDVLISRHHAEIRRLDSGFEVVDLGSRNGTYHNGRQVRRAELRAGDLITIGRFELVFDGQRLQEYESSGPVSLTADDLTVRIGDAILLDDVSFSLEEGSLLAVIGPSGCGKSTLVRALTGLRPATQGRVRYDGRDLYNDYAELRYRIGMVPQDDVVHRQLKVRRALRFAAALRFADDVPRKERNKRVEEVLDTLNLTERGSQKIDTLSGGQRKRVSVAMELLTEPSLLTLDEPTSGLDPALDREVMEELRELADKGRTVVVVTHNVLHLDMCDRVLVMCLGGTMGYFGPPDQVLEFFGAKDYADVFAAVTDEPKRWTSRYRGSELYRRYVTDPAERPQSAPAPAVAAAPKDAEQQPAQPAKKSLLGRVTGMFTGELGGTLKSAARHPTAPLRQFFTLCMRMVAVIASDRGYSLFLLGLPLALALLTHTVPGDNGLGPPIPPARFSLEAQRLLVVLLVGAAFLGTAAAIREIVNEQSIYRRERAVGLSPGSYLASKIVVFTVINTIQVILFVYLALLGNARPADPLIFDNGLTEIMIPVALVAITCTILGLLVSALARTTEQTTPILVIAVMAQLVLSGGLFELAAEPALNAASWIFPTRWGFAAGASTVDLLSMIPLSIQDPLWEHEASQWWRSVVFIVLQAVILTGATRLALRRHEPGKS
jgi:ABC-type multidrug transport system ATPase subunit/pSer/pThr/pTyr-binding forkhead associated (FHA) protein